MWFSQSFQTPPDGDDATIASVGCSTGSATTASLSSANLSKSLLCLFHRDESFSQDNQQCGWIICLWLWAGLWLKTQIEVRRGSNESGWSVALRHQPALAQGKSWDIDSGFASNHDIGRLLPSACTEADVGSAETEGATSDVLASYK